MINLNPIRVMLATPIILAHAASSFAPAAARWRSRREPGRKVQTATFVRAPSSAVSDPRRASDELLRLLQSKAAAPKTDGGLDDQINSLIRTLVASRAPFDPAESVYGPLFASVHFVGDTPLWEKIGAGAVRNVKGQKYTLPDDGASGTFVNYAEILGGNLYLKAAGDCKDEGPAAAETESSKNPAGALASLLQRKSTLLPTPYDYSATVTGASVVFFQKFCIDLAIEGTGTVRVLYADENLRIFLSPTDTNVTKGGGDWESEGLVVVQVRVDLVYDWDDPL